jgi:N-carbamoylputrescine amidase
MKVTVCELPNRTADLEVAWLQLVDHVAKNGSDLVLLPEMPFYRWLPQTGQVDTVQWRQAVRAHHKWIERFQDLAPATVVSSRPVLADNTPKNVGFVWEAGAGTIDVHAKRYLPDEPGFWEASWYRRGDGNFAVANTKCANIGFLICTELWFTQHARDYGQRGAHMIACPRATPATTTSKWIAGGRSAAVISGAFCLSSNLTGTSDGAASFGGVGWIIEPEDGQILGLTSATDPFLSVEVDLDAAEHAKKTYPRYVED